MQCIQLYNVVLQTTVFFFSVQIQWQSYIVNDNLHVLQPALYCLVELMNCQTLWYFRRACWNTSQISGPTLIPNEVGMSNLRSVVGEFKKKDHLYVS